MKLTFIDAGVLIAAARGSGDLAVRAMQVLDDPELSFASSPFVQLEVLPKASFHGRSKEAAFYKVFFETVEQWAVPDEALVQRAVEQALEFGLSAMDALHVAAALTVGAEEIVTIEKLGRPIHRVTTVAVTTIHP